MATEHDIANSQNLPTGNESSANETTDKFGVNAMVTLGSITYIGMEEKNGFWFIKKMDETTGMVLGYATINNNSNYSSYSDAWTNKATLTYGNYSQAF